MKKIYYLLAIIFSITACLNTQNSNLKGKTFTLDNSNIILTFDKDENKFYGKALNNYFGNYKLENNNLTFEITGSTMMMGAPKEMEDETKYFQDLSKINSYNIKNKTLTLKGNNVELIYQEK